MSYMSTDTTPAASWADATPTERKLAIALASLDEATTTLAVDPFLHTVAGRDAAYAASILEGTVARLAARALWEDDQRASTTTPEGIV